MEIPKYRIKEKEFSPETYKRIEKRIISYLGSQLMVAMSKRDLTEYAARYALVQREVGSGYYPAQKSQVGVRRTEESRWNSAIECAELGDWTEIREELAKDGERFKNGGDVESIEKGYVLEQLSKLI